MIKDIRLTSPNLSRRSLSTIESGRVLQVPSENEEESPSRLATPPYAIEKDLLLSWEFLLYWLVRASHLLTT